MRHILILFVLLSFACAAGQVMVLGQDTKGRKLVLEFEGNNAFSKHELLNVVYQCVGEHSKLTDPPNSDVIDYCLGKVKAFMFAKGYLRATVGETRQEQTESGGKTIVSVNEGALYRLGHVKIEGSKVLTAAQILEMLTLKSGDVANAEALGEWAYGRVKKVYADLGYLQYTAELNPDFPLQAGAQEDIVDFTVILDEGKLFKVRSINFEGNGGLPQDMLLGIMSIRIGEVFNKQMFDDGLKKVGEVGQFEMIDTDRDVDYNWDRKNPLLDLTIHLKKRTAILPRE